ncbi:FAD/NAD(P)-binding protein [Spirillospora sp. NBC_01491]|uniref:FAD/NAD(P)-binding protein n=1 Tax=Spirillospora sp. NBC_01491 TaxID=2976007 RepID=UPI002E3710F3|nr:FAD/NAD(P)-binding protein [Spirillospora sp. NBC_01491]
MTVEPLRIVVVGAGPGGTVMAGRLAANAPDLVGDRPLELHLVDPYPPGGGRVWRREQSRLLWMNSQAREITMFTDDTVRMEGPVRPGPSIVEWGATRGRPMDPAHFPSRREQNAYLGWCFEQVAETAPANVRVRVHRATAVDLTESGDRQFVRLAGRGAGAGAVLAADAVLLVQGSLHTEPDPAQRGLAAYAGEHGLMYVPPHYAADADLDAVPAGEPVVMRGMGLTFVDDMALLAEGRGGRFEPGPGGALTYRPSGREPVMYPGSRRGVPYLSKITYARDGVPRPAPRYLTPGTAEALYARSGPLDLERDLWPLAAKELGHFYYHRLFTAHPERTSRSWASFLAAYDGLVWDGPERAALVAASVPGEGDRLDVRALLDPASGLRFGASGGAPEELRRWLRGYIAGNAARHSDPSHSADLALLDGLLTVFGVILGLIDRGLLSARSHAEELFEWFQSVFSYCTSGPPPRRLRELEALSRAGIVRFMGPGLRVEARDGVFAASGTHVPEPVRARVLIDSRQPSASLARVRDPLLRGLYERGEATAETLVGADGTPYPLGRLAVRGHRLVDARGRAHPRRYALGARVGQGLLMAGFNRPRANGSSFRTADALARTILTGLRR